MRSDVGCGTSAEPFTAAQRLFDRNPFKTKCEICYIVVLTDGCWGNSDNAINVAKKCHKRNIEIMALGFGDADYSFLKKIASTDEFASVTNLANLGGSFSKIAQAIGEGSTGLSMA